MKRKGKSKIDSETVKNSFYSRGADLCGIASIDRFEEAPAGCHPRDLMPGCQSIIVFANRIRLQPAGDRPGGSGRDIRGILTEITDRMAKAFCADMARKGILAEAVRTDRLEVDEKTGQYQGTLSARHAAQAAGLGRIGRNSLLLTPEYGSMIWLGVVLTQADLKADPLKAPICDNCRLCISACPVNALKNDTVDDREACMQHCAAMEQKGWGMGCHKCRDVCPYLYGERNKIIIAV